MPPKRKMTKKVTRYTYDELKEPRVPETGDTPLLPEDEQVVTLPMDNGWSKAIEVGKLPDYDHPVVVDMDPSADPVLFWAGKRNRREVPVLPLQRNEIVTESRISQIIERARKAAEERSGATRQGHLQPPRGQLAGRQVGTMAGVAPRRSFHGGIHAAKPGVFEFLGGDLQRPGVFAPGKLLGFGRVTAGADRRGDHRGDFDVRVLFRARTVHGQLVGGCGSVAIQAGDVGPGVQAHGPVPHLARLDA